MKTTSQLWKGCIFAFIACWSGISTAQYNYNDTLEKAIYFFDANKCGPDVANDNVFSSWRGACHTDDGAAVGVDLSGGFHDAGDHVKFGLPQAWSAATLGWALYEYRSVFDNAGVTPKMLNTLKHFTDYFLKSHTDANTFYYNIGDGNQDHAYWGPPEDQTGARPIIAATPSKPASDVCGEAAAALALMYLNYQSTDAAYANQCLDAAKSIYDLGKNHLGRSDDGGGGSFYRSSSHFDDLSWGGIWLSVATGDTSYLTPIDAWMDVPNDYGDDNYNKRWAPAWDDATVFVLLKMYELTGVEKYRQGVINNLEWYRDQCPRTPYGLPWLSNWGVLRYGSAEAGVGYTASKIFNYSGYLETADLTIDYCLGDNPRNSSYITGLGNNPPVHPHHRANEPDYYYPNTGNTNGMVGGLVGGPDQSDGYSDAIADFQRSEVGIDYNASFILGLAGKIYKDGGGSSNTNPIAVVAATPVSGTAPLEVQFDGSGSSDPDGDSISYSWNFGDGNSSTEENPSHIYTASGNFAAALTVSDGKGGSNTKSITITVTGGNSGAPVANISASATSGKAPLVVSFDASGSTDPDNDINSYSWDFGDGNTATGISPSHTFQNKGNYTVTLTVTDQEGLTGTATQGITVTDDGGTDCGNYLSVSGNKLLDSNGNEVRLTGINWFGFETSALMPHGLWSRDFKSMLQQIKDLGFNSLRIPWSNKIMDPSVTIQISSYDSDPYTGVSPMNEVESTFTHPLQLMDALVEWCQANDMKIVLDNHSREPDGYISEALWYTSNVSEDKWIADWVALAERYKDYDAVIGMDLNNEPHDEATWGDSSPATDWNKAAERCGNAILAVNPNVLIIVEGIEEYEGENYWWGGNLKGAADYPIQISNPSKLMYSPHEYGPTVYPQPWFTVPEFPGNMEGIWNEHFGFLYNEGTSPLYNGEFGLKTQGGTDEVWFDTWIAYMGADYSWAYWSWNPNSGDTGGILADDWTSINTWKMDKIRPYMEGFIPNTGGSGDCNPDNPPIARAGNDQNIIDQDDNGEETVSLDGSSSSDPAGGTLTYRWAEGGTELSTQVSPTITLPVGSHTITLTVTNSKGLTDSDVVVINIQPFNQTDQLSVSTNNVSFGANAESASINVTSTISWSVSESTAWINIAPSSGSNNGSFDISVSQNNSAARTAQVTVSGAGLSEVITVTQAAGGGNNDCAFGTPIATPLPNMNAKSYKYSHVLGSGGPDLSNVSDFVINWDLANNGLWQFSMQTTNGIPTWWVNLLNVSSHTFGSSNPGVTISGSGFSGLDGSYYVNTVGSDFVMVSKTGNFTIYFSNNATAPSCSNKANNGTVSFRDLAYPNPFGNQLRLFVDQPESVLRIDIINFLGQQVYSLKNTQIASENEINLEGIIPSGVYTMSIIREGSRKNLRIIKK